MVSKLVVGKIDSILIYLFSLFLFAGSPLNCFNCFWSCFLYLLSRALDCFGNLMCSSRSLIYSTSSISNHTAVSKLFCSLIYFPCSVSCSNHCFLDGRRKFIYSATLPQNAHGF